MKKYLILFISCLCFVQAIAQKNGSDSSVGMVSVKKDARIEILGKKMAEYNESLAKKIHSAKGYRLMILNSTDRAQVLQVRSNLLQLFPNQGIYMVFQSPFMKLKFGNFLDRREADEYRKQIVAAKIVKGNIYIIPDTIEIKAEKPVKQDE